MDPKSKDKKKPKVDLDKLAKSIELKSKILAQSKIVRK